MSLLCNFRPWFVIILTSSFIIVGSTFASLREESGGGGAQSTMTESDACTESGYFGSSADCAQFYRCVCIDNTPNCTLYKFRFDCPPGLIFDRNISSCNHAHDVNPKPSACSGNSDGTGSGAGGPGSGSSPIQPPAPLNNKVTITGSKFGLINSFKFNNTDGSKNSTSLDEVEAVHLENLYVNPEQLINYLALTPNLKSLVLRNVQLTADFEDSVYLPKLQEFHLSHVNLVKSPFAKPNAEMALIQEFKTRKASFKSILFFFTNESTWNWKLEDVSKFKTNVSISIHGTLIFRMSGAARENNELASQLYFTDEIISNWSSAAGVPLEKLTLTNLTLNSVPVPSTLKYIDFQAIAYRNGNLSDILRRNRGLAFVRLGIVKDSGTQSVVYLSDLPKRLEYLDVSNGVVLKSPKFQMATGSYDDHVEFQHLTIVRFDHCLLEMTVLAEFSAIFNTRTVEIISPLAEQHYALLKEILKRTDKLYLIAMREFGRYPNPKPEAYEEIEGFLTKAGVGEAQTNFNLVKKQEGVWLAEMNSGVGGLYQLSNLI